MVKKIGGYFLVVTGFLACPCHLPLTLPLALALLSGTALGAFLTLNQGLVVTGTILYFIGAVVLGLRLLNSRGGPDQREACSPAAGVAKAQPGKTEKRGLPVVSGRAGARDS